MARVKMGFLDVRSLRPKNLELLNDDRWHHALLRKIVSYALLVATVFLALVPLWQITVIALDPAAVPTTSAWYVPRNVNLDNFFRLLTETHFLRWLVNSLFVAFAVTVLGVSLASTCGYAISRFRFVGRQALVGSLPLTQIFPATMLLLPIFLILVRLQLINTFLGLMMIYLATVLPFCIWQMKGFYDGVPESIEEAAAMDGCSPAEVYWRVVLPVSAQGLSVTALFSFAAAWNEYVVAAILMQDPELFTLPIGLRLLHVDGMSGHPGLFAAGALIVTVPMVVLYMLLSRFLVARVQESVSANR